MSDPARLYEQMRRIRSFEERVSVLYRDGEIPGFCHVSIGQESVAAGVCAALRPTDVITSTHRGHGHVLAKGTDPEGMFAELMGRASGVCRGLGGSMHIADPKLGVFGANGIVGAGLPIAVGAGLAARARGAGDVAVAFFGDGAVAQGTFHESLNLAALRRLPVLFACENNKIAEFSTSETQHPVPPAARGAAYGIESTTVDGADVGLVAATAAGLVERLRAGEGPFLLEVEVERWHGHYEGDPLGYRPAGARELMEAKDPVARARAGLDEGVAREIDDRVEAEMAAALEAARAAEPATELDLRTYLWAPTVVTGRDDVGEGVVRYMDAIRSALEDALDADPSVYVAGVDVSTGIFRVTSGLAERFGRDRIIDTPISESALIGSSVGAAMAGMRPVAELMFVDFIGVCFDQLLNQAAKLRFMTGGAVDIPLVVRTQYGAGRSAGAQHSQSLEGLLAAVPGLCVVVPSTPADAYGLLRTAIEERNPVVFIEHRHLYGRKGPAPGRDHRVPLGSAAVVRPGADVTVCAVGRQVHQCVAAATALAGEGIEVEVVDLRSVAPLDVETVAASVVTTGRLAVCQESSLPFGLGSEVIAAVQDVAFWDLDAPPIRIGAGPTPAPYAPPLEAAWLPDEARITHELRELARR